MHQSKLMDWMDEQPELTRGASERVPGQASGNPGRDLVDCLAHLRKAPSDTPAVAAVVARVARQRPFLDDAARRRRAAFRTAAFATAVFSVAVSAAVIWLWPSAMTPESERAGLSTVVSAAESDLVRAMKSLGAVSGSASPKMSSPVSAPSLPSSSALAINIDTSSPSSLAPQAHTPAASVTLGVAGQALLGGRPPASPPMGEPLDEPPAELPH